MPEPTYDDRRRSFGAVARSYDKYRPGYPDDSISWAIGREPIRVLDLAAGTGRLTRSLMSVGHRVVAVEPDEQMIAVLRENLDAETHLGTAESIPLPDASVDAVAVGQAFHWFDPAAAVAEMARVLVPGGRLGLLWNVLDDRVPWVDALAEVSGGEARWSLTHDEPHPDLAPHFVEVETFEFPHGQTMDLAHLRGLVASWSYVYLSDRRLEILSDVEAVARGHLDPRSGELALPYVTSVVRARKA